MITNDLITYLLKVAAMQGIFIGAYWLLFNRQTLFGLNRLYLLGTLVLSLVIPFMENPFPRQVNPIANLRVAPQVTQAPLHLPAQPMAAETLQVQEPATFSWWQVLLWVYIAVVVLFIVRSAFYLLALQREKKQSEYVKQHWFKLYKTDHSSAFSFFRNVFIPKSVFGTDAFDPILAHECVHVRQLHSADRLLMDLLVSLFWFNPFIYLYRKALIEVHEFEADAQVLRQYNNPLAYQEILFAQLQPASDSALVSHFNFSTIKKRIVMMNKSKNTKSQKRIYLLILPLLAVVLLAFASQNKPADEGFALQQEQQDTTRPLSDEQLRLHEKQESVALKQKAVNAQQAETRQKQEALSVLEKATVKKQGKLTKEQEEKLSMEQHRLAETQKALAEEQQKLAETQRALSEAQKELAEKEAQLHRAKEAEQRESELQKKQESKARESNTEPEKQVIRMDYKKDEEGRILNGPFFVEVSADGC